MKTLTIVSYFTKHYAYALKAQARRVLANLDDLKPDEWQVNFVACTDRSAEASEAFSYYEQQGDAAGHLPWRAALWYASEHGEQFSTANDGDLRPAAPVAATPKII